MRIAALLVCLTGWFSAPAQTWYSSSASAPAVRPALYRAIVYTETGLRTEGIFYELTDSTLRYVRNTRENIHQLRAGEVPDVLEIPGETIVKVTLRRKGHVGRGALIGAGIGLIASGVILLAIPEKDVLSLFIRTLYAIGAPVAGAEYGALLSIIPRKQVYLRRNGGDFKGGRFELLPFSYRFQQSGRVEKSFAN